MIKVLNKNKDDCSCGEYIGRGSSLGNPYYFGESNHSQAHYKVKNRDEAIDKYIEHLDLMLKDGDPAICDAIRELQIKQFRKEDINLICFCAPLRCHGEAIQKKVEESKYCTNWFSNMRPFDEPMIYDGISFRTPEHFYQAMKTKNRGEREHLAGLNPYAAKTVARKKIAIREDWGDIKLKVMEYALKYKFAEGTTWREKLKECKSKIVEYNNWGDKFWGVDIHTGMGENHLGKLIEKLR